jgi:RNA polymerase sigma-70 factor, ECF subfamily
MCVPGFECRLAVWLSLRRFLRRAEPTNLTCARRFSFLGPFSLPWPARIDRRRFSPQRSNVPRTCQAWVDDLKPGSGATYTSALADLRDFLRRTLARAFAAELDDGDLDDLVQESLLRIHERLGSFEHRSRFTTWAAAIAVNCAYSELRRRRYRHVSLDDAVELGAASLVQPEVAHQQPDREAALRAAIDAALTSRQREAILALLGGLPLAEIARRSASSQGAVYKLLHDARRRLKHHLEAQDDEAPVSHAKGGAP